MAGEVAELDGHPPPAFAEVVGEQVAPAAHVPQRHHEPVVAQPGRGFGQPPARFVADTDLGC
ncbi:MAG: hypothetical protein ACKVT1_19185 [Dehalococcoidia bacterium]